MYKNDTDCSYKLLTVVITDIREQVGSAPDQEPFP